MRMSQSIAATSMLTVALSLISSPAFAHRADTEAREEMAVQQRQMLSDVQALQAEVAKLRDLIERQQYELSRYQRQQQNSNRAPTQPQYIPSESGLVLAPTTGAVSENTQPALGVPTTGSTIAYPDAAAANSQVPTQDGAYDPNYPSSYPEAGAQNEVFDPNASPDSPPVEERIIGGGQPASGDTVGSNPMGVNSQGQVAIAGSVQSNPNLNAVPIEQVPAPTGGGVLSVPNSVATGGSGETETVDDFSVTDPSNGLDPTAQVNPDDAIAASLSENDLYQRAFSLLRESNHKEAVEVFEQQIETFPYGEYADDANYWIAESKYVNRDLTGSKKFFKVILDSYKQSPRLPDAMLKIAYIEQEQGNLMEARLLLQEILQFHPRSNAAISAKNRLAALDS